MRKVLFSLVAALAAVAVTGCGDKPESAVPAQLSKEQVDQSLKQQKSAADEEMVRSKKESASQPKSGSDAGTEEEERRSRGGRR